MSLYRLTKGAYYKTKEALELASKNTNSEIFVRRTIGLGGIRAQFFPIYHVENASVKLSPLDCSGKEDYTIEFAAKTKFAEREAVSALEHLPWLYGLTDRKIKLRKFIPK